MKEEKRKEKEREGRADEKFPFPSIYVTVEFGGVVSIGNIRRVTPWES